MALGAADPNPCPTWPLFLALSTESALRSKAGKKKTSAQQNAPRERRENRKGPWV